QQMVALARALVGRPRLLMLDEPSLGLAPRLVDEVFALVRRMRDEEVTVLLVEQNVARALAVADDAHVLERRRLVASGRADAPRRGSRPPGGERSRGRAPALEPGAGGLSRSAIGARVVESRR